MESLKNQIDYFKDLERLTKVGLYSYLFLLVLGITISISGTKNFYYLISNPSPCEISLIILACINIFQLFKLGVDRIQWLGEVHIWLDNRLFRFLYKSNEIILRELLRLLDPNERILIDKLASGKRTLIAQSVFSKLADDQSIFANLLKKGIFRSWIWYWITMYGISIFLILSTIAFIKILISPSLYSKALFVSIGSVTGLEIIFGLILGYNLLMVTKKVIREITDLHSIEIVALLRAQMK